MTQHLLVADRHLTADQTRPCAVIVSGAWLGSLAFTGSAKGYRSFGTNPMNENTKRITRRLGRLTT